LNKNHLKKVLIVFPSTFSANRKDNLKTIVKEKLELIHVKVNKIISEESCIAFEVTNLVGASASLVDMFGIDKVAIAKHVTNGFTDIVTTIVNTGKQIIFPGEKFFVKVQMSSNAKVSYVGRDIEFVSSSNLIAELSSIAAKPAKNEHEANKTILSYIGKDSAYVCIQMDTAHGGLPFGSQKEKVACSIHNVLSAVSCLITVKCGFVPDFLILYTNNDDLKENAKIFSRIANKTCIKKHKIRVAYIDLPDKLDHNLKLMLQESISANILTHLPENRLIIPLSTAIHPTWFVEATMKKIVFAGKTPWLPLMFLTDSIYHTAKDAGLEDKTTSIDTLIKDMAFKREEYEKYENKIDALSKAAIENMKTIPLKIGPNYLHDIIDSI
jgi:hypothetical protein